MLLKDKQCIDASSLKLSSSSTNRLCADKLTYPSEDMMPNSQLLDKIGQESHAEAPGRYTLCGRGFWLLLGVAPAGGRWEGVGGRERRH